MKIILFLTFFILLLCQSTNNSNKTHQNLTEEDILITADDSVHILHRLFLFVSFQKHFDKSKLTAQLLDF